VPGMSTPWPVAGRTILITGAARGIGAESAKQLRAKGAKLALVGLEPELLEQRASELGGDVAWFEANVSEPGELAAAVEGAVERFGGIDAVIANAGIAGGGPVATMDADAFDRIIDVNLLGVVRTVRACLPYVLERQGYVLPIASLAAALHGPMMSAYSASKAGVEAFADSLRIEIADTGAKVGCAYFSFIDTDMVRRGLDRPSAQRARERMMRGPLKPPPVSVAGEAIVRGIERRARHVVAPKWVLPALYLRTLIQPLTERAPREDIRESMRLAAEEATELTTEQPPRAARS
jgi:NAD(P)-dependent dehydrogenase (short-subunit alcohol dehydrogenase family)